MRTCKKTKQPGPETLGNPVWDQEGCLRRSGQKRHGTGRTTPFGGQAILKRGNASEDP